MRFQKRDDPSEGGGKFLKLKDGQYTTGVLRGEIYEFYSKWDNGKSHLTDPLDPEGRVRFRANLVVREEKSFQAKIWEFPLAIYNNLAALQEAYDDLENIKIRIIRNGTGTDTTYTILPMLKEPISQADLLEIKTTPLNILEHKDASGFKT